MNTLKELLLNNKNTQKAIPAFNIDSFEIFQAVEAAVQETSLPCIVQLSPNEDSFIQAEKLFLLVKKARLEGLPIYLNMDHGKDTARLTSLIKLGYDMVHFDGSSLPYADNLAAAIPFVANIKSINPEAIVEVEFNKINLIEKGVDPDSYTDPAQAAEFIGQTQADLLAVSIGNLHGVNANLPEIIDLERFKKITEALPNSLFTLHGGSGISPDLVISAINLGIVKININTDLRLQFKKSLGKYFSEINSEKIYDYFNPVISDLKTLIIFKLKSFAQYV